MPILSSRPGYAIELLDYLYTGIGTANTEYLFDNAPASVQLCPTVCGHQENTVDVLPKLGVPVRFLVLEVGQVGVHASLEDVILDIVDDVELFPDGVLVVS